MTEKENTFLDEFEKATALKKTENGATAYSTTFDKVMDLFAFGGAYRNRSANAQVKLFEKAYNEDPLLALKCLFYLRDCRGGKLIA